MGAAYDAAVARAAPDDLKVASSTTRVRDFVNRGPEFDALYLHPPVLKACCHVINEPFRLSTMHARTVRPDLPAQNLHVDFERDSHGWTMVGFIFTVDEFRNDNGATSFRARFTLVDRSSIRPPAQPQGRLSWTGAGVRSSGLHDRI